jgi:diguanylate cyclase (GGDEF)-like protein
VFDVEYIWSLSLMVCSTAIFFGFEIFNPATDYKEAIGTSVYFAIGFFGSSIARKTQTLLGKKSFLMSLRDGYRSAALKEANRQLEILATRDPLTGLANRRSAARFIETLWRDRTIPKACVAFIMADLDSFKRLNDTAGHAAGDICIQRVAKAIEQSVRPGDDAVFRYGGEEFLIVLTNATADLAWTLAERIRRAVEALVIVNPGIHPVAGSAGVVTVSLGVAFAQEDAGPEMVAKWADDASTTPSVPAGMWCFCRMLTPPPMTRGQPRPLHHRRIVWQSGGEFCRNDGFAATAHPARTSHSRRKASACC